MVFFDIHSVVRLSIVTTLILLFSVFSSPLHTEPSAILARQDDGIQQSVLLFIDDGFDTHTALHGFFEANFDNYDSAAYLQTKNKNALIQGIANFAAQKIDEHTMVTVYYGGFGFVRDDENWMIDNDQLIKLAQSHGANRPEKEGVPLFRGLIDIFAKQNPAGLVVFYFPEPTINEDATFVRQSLPDVALFLPGEAGKHLDLTQQNLSQPISTWATQSGFIGEYIDNLNYEKYRSYCLQPSIYGCDGDMSSEEIAAAKLSTDSATGVSDVESSPQACAEPIIAQTSQPLATRLLQLQSDCRSGELVTVDYAGYQFSTNLDASGSAEVAIPLLAAESETLIHWQDGSTNSVMLTVADPDELARLDRVILSWTGKEQLDLHALSFRVEINSEQDVWRETYCQAATSPESAHHLKCYPGSGKEPRQLQVYTRERDNDQQQRGIIDFRVDFFDRGSNPSLPFCGDGDQAEVDFTTQRIIAGRADNVRQYQFASVPCGASLAAKVRYLRSAVEQIHVR